MRTNSKISAALQNAELIDNGFSDIIELSRNCKFGDCTHTTEPDCAVLEAISNGVLAKDRFDNYFKQKHEGMYVSRQRNKTKAIDYMKQLKLFERP